MNYIRFVDTSFGRAFYSNAGELAEIWERYVTNAETASEDTADRYIAETVQGDEDYQSWIGTL